nr:hypothetical protein [Lachnobacterium bovis]
MNKSDLADKRQSEEWSKYFQAKGYFVYGLDARTKKWHEEIN